MQSPLDKVVFIQKVASFIKTDSASDLFQLAYVNNSWNDTIKNYSVHLFEERVLNVGSVGSLNHFCDRVIKCGVLWFANVIMSSETLLKRINLSWLVCRNASSPGASSVDMMQLALEKIYEAGGKDFVLNQLTETTSVSGMSCLLFSCSYSSSPQFVQLIFDKIEEAGGRALQRSQLTATSRGDRTCLMLVARFSSSQEVVKLIFEKIIEVGGADLLKNQLVATDRNGRNCLMLACSDSSSPEVMTLFAAVLFGLGLFEQQYANLDDGRKERLRNKTEIENASWVPDPESIAEVKKILR